MSINLTISADSAADFFTHLRELNAGFHRASVSYVASSDTAAHTPEKTVDRDAPTVTVATAAETATAPEPKAARKPRAAKETEKTEDAKPDTAASSAEASTPESSSQTSDSGQTAQAGASPSEDPGQVGPYPDFDTEVTPVVLGAVRAKGKEWVSAILGEFGVEKASQLADNRFQELIDTINDRLA